MGKTVAAIYACSLRATLGSAMLYCAAAAATCIAEVRNLNFAGGSALAASTPPEDAQPMSPGQRVRSRLGPSTVLRRVRIQFLKLNS